MINKITPGQVLKEEFMDPLNLTSEALSEKIGIPMSVVEGIIKGEERITETIARRLSEYFEVSMEFWINLEGLQLSKKDTKTFFESLHNPSEPNTALIKAKESAKRLLKPK